MTNLLVVKEYLKNFYSKYEVYLSPFLKFLLAFITLITINGTLGYMEKIKNMAIVLVIALFCSFMPSNFIVLAAALFVILHLYAISLECAVVALAVFLLMFLLYFRFTPKDTIVVVFTPLLFAMKIPYVIPVALGILGGPVSAVSAACGVAAYYVINYAAENAKMLSTMEVENTAQKFRFMIDGLMDNKSMYVMIAAFAVTIILVYTIRRLSVDYAWTIAIIAGALVNVLILLVGDLMFELNFSILSIIIGSIISVAVGKILQFFVMNLDYTRTESVQFEDDEYYYYVKAVPKITVATPEKKVKKITTQRKPSESRPVRQAGSTGRGNENIRTVHTVNRTGSKKS